jgi:hypothetical protein
MDLLSFLRRRLDFVSHLHDGAISPFVEKEGKIEAGEEPYEDLRNAEFGDVSEPPFLDEWLEAHESCEIIGMWGLCMVQQALKSYLEEYLAQLQSDYYRKHPKFGDLVSQKRAPGWFERYRLFFLEDLKVDWHQSGVNLDDLEHLNLTRNDFTHNVDLRDTGTYQIKAHAERFPKGMFVDQLWGESKIMGGRLRVDRETLKHAIQIVLTFCEYLEGIRTRWMDHIRSFPEQT